MKGLAICVSFLLLSVSFGTQSFLEKPSDSFVASLLEKTPFPLDADPIHPTMPKVNVDEHVPAPAYFPDSLKGKTLKLTPPAPIAAGDRVKDKFHLDRDYPAYWDPEANAYQQKIEDNFQMMRKMLWNGPHMTDFSTAPGTEIGADIGKSTEYGRPEGAWLGWKTQGKYDEIMALFKADGKRVWDDMNKCISDMMDYSWTWHQQMQNEKYAMANVCSAQNRDAIRDVYVNHQIDYYHNLFNICDMKYEMELVDAIKPQAWAAVEGFFKGPGEVLKGFDMVNQHLENAKVASDVAKMSVDADEKKKEDKRVNEAETINMNGRIDYHKKLETAVEKIAEGAKTRFMNEPFTQFYDEMENQIYEDMKQLEKVSAKWWPQFCQRLFDTFLAPTEIRAITTNDFKVFDDDKWP